MTYIFDARYINRLNSSHSLGEKTVKTYKKAESDENSAKINEDARNQKQQRELEV